jgi:hypothetical protein
MTTDGQPLPTARLARGGDLTPDPALYPFASRWLASSAGAMHYSDEGSGPAILFCSSTPTASFAGSTSAPTTPTRSRSTTR